MAGGSYSHPGGPPRIDVMQQPAFLWRPEHTHTHSHACTHTQTQMHTHRHPCAHGGVIRPSFCLFLGVSLRSPRTGRNAFQYEFVGMRRNGSLCRFRVSFLVQRCRVTVCPRFFWTDPSLNIVQGCPSTRSWKISLVKKQIKAIILQYQHALATHILKFAVLDCEKNMISERKC